MSESFRLGTLDQLIDFKNGKAVKKSNGTVPIYGGNGILGYTDQSNYKTNLIVGRVGAYCGSVHIEKHECWVSDNAIAGIPKNSNSIDYCYYLLKSLKLNEQQVGSSQPLLTQGILNNIQVKIEFDSKRQILLANTLSTLDAKIDCNNRLNAELESMAKMLYDYWFVQFDFPDTSGRPYRTTGGKMLYNEVLKREIPAHWENSNVLAIADILGGGTPTKKKPEFWGGSIPFFTPTDASGSIFKFSTSDYITDAGLNGSSTKLFDKNTVFITARGSVGKLVLAGVQMAMNQSCYALRAKENVGYVFMFFMAKELIHHLQIKSSGSVFDSIVSNDIELTQLAIPSIDLIQQFSVITEPMFEKISNNTKENEQLAELRDWLLPMLMNGQVVVS